jgi:hypothetical protein
VKSENSLPSYYKEGGETSLLAIKQDKKMLKRMRYHGKAQVM